MQTRLKAWLRLRLRRSRPPVFLGGTAVSTLLLLFCSHSSIDYDGAVIIRDENYVKFLFLNPPVIILQECARVVEANATVVYGACLVTSLAWWALVAAVVGRRHARTLTPCI